MGKACKVKLKEKNMRRARKAKLFINIIDKVKNIKLLGSVIDKPRNTEKIKLLLENDLRFVIPNKLRQNMLWRALLKPASYLGLIRCNVITVLHGQSNIIITKAMNLNIGSMLFLFV